MTPRIHPEGVVVVGCCAQIAAGSGIWAGIRLRGNTAHSWMRNPAIRETFALQLHAVQIVLLCEGIRKLIKA